MPKPRLLILDDNISFVESLSRALRQRFSVVATHNVRDAQAAIESNVQLGLVDVVLKEDVTPPDRSGLEFIKWAAPRFPDVPLVILTAHGADELEVEALRIGAADFIEKDRLNLRLLEAKIRALLERRAILTRSRELASRLERYEPHELIGKSPAVAALRDQVQQIAATDSTVFVFGESGAGKEVVARAIHHASSRSERPFVAVNCAAVGGGISESELFGHERGSFTGADRQRIGYFEAANGGTILLDEVTEMSLDLQAKLLRVLQDRRFRRLGSSEEIEVDVRIIATTNRVPAEAVNVGKMREDLFFRLNVVPIRVPSLRERPTDIPLLSDYFLRRAAERIPYAPKRFSVDAVTMLTKYAWPGNVRELENLVERACTLCRSSEIPGALVSLWLIAPSVTKNIGAESNETDFERVRARAALQALSHALEMAGGMKEKAQQLLGFKDRSTMRRNVGVLRRDFPEIWAEFPALGNYYR